MGNAELSAGPSFLHTLFQFRVGHGIVNWCESLFPSMQVTKQSKFVPKNNKIKRTLFAELSRSRSRGLLYTARPRARKLRELYSPNCQGRAAYCTRRGALSIEQSCYLSLSVYRHTRKCRVMLVTNNMCKLSKRCSLLKLPARVGYSNCRDCNNIVVTPNTNFQSHCNSPCQITFRVI